MSEFKRVIDDDPGRAAAKAARLAKFQRVSTSPQLQNLLPDVVGDEPNMLPKAFQGVDNNVLIEEVLELSPPVPAGRTIYLQLLWDGVPAGDEISATTPVDTTQTLVLKGADTSGEGRHSLSYRLIYAGNPTNYDQPVSIFIDKEPPNKNVAGAKMELPTEYADGRITKERLDADPDIVLTIPRHSDRRVDDVIEVYYGKSVPGRLIGTYTAPDNSNSPMTVTLTKAQVEAGSEGEQILYYKMIDRTGNEGPVSHELDVVVELTAAPANLKDLKVDEAPDPDRLIDIKDAIPDVLAQVDAYDNINPSDRIQLTWDGIVQPEKRASDGAPWLFDVPFADVKRNGLGPRAVTVSYLVRRGNQEYPGPTFAPVNVDLRRAGPGPDDPDDPETGNPKLAPVTTQAKNTTDPNKFELVDVNEDGTAATTVSDDRATGDVYQLYWNKVLVPAPGGVYTVTGNEADGDPIEFTIPWALIRDQGNNAALPVHYEITNPGLPPGNSNNSLRQPVDVHVIAVTLPEVKVNFVQTIGGTEYLNCSSLRNISNVGWAAVVGVKGGAPLEDAMTLKFKWTGNAFDDTGPVPVPDYEFTKTLSGGEHLNGTTVYLPHDAALKPIRDGNGTISYEVTVGGRDETSNAHTVEVVVRDGQGNDCPLP
ncbi:hypothetical protein N8H74_20195 [Pseudomonas sp. B2M1-30]|uniref:hypothetical protein n=1 Tax=Pseudomonas TaxID=286 RepID=UPI0021CA8945|nr:MULTISPECIES: hypothetical protein [Pseudomonas]MCU0120589.1 hypothetical protein [Pseudomonas sp. B2M1-30]MCU7262607.1 hypothetical protein [Pseudomonas koreensis]